MKKKKLVSEKRLIAHIESLVESEGKYPEFLGGLNAGPDWETFLSEKAANTAQSINRWLEAQRLELMGEAALELGDLFKRSRSRDVEKQIQKALLSGEKEAFEYETLQLKDDLARLSSEVRSREERLLVCEQQRRELANKLQDLED